MKVKEVEVILKGMLGHLENREKTNDSRKKT